MVVACKYREDKTCSRTKTECRFERAIRRNMLDKPEQKCEFYIMPEYRIEQIRSLEPGMPLSFNYRTAGSNYSGDYINTGTGTLKEIHNGNVIIETKAVLCDMPFPLHGIGQAFFIDRHQADREREAIEQQEYDRKRIEKEGRIDGESEG